MAFNPFFKESLEQLATTFGHRTVIITPPNYKYQVLSFEETNGEEITNILTNLKGSKAQDVLVGY